MVEHQLPKLSVEGSIPFARSNRPHLRRRIAFEPSGRLADLMKGALEQWQVPTSATSTARRPSRTSFRATCLMIRLLPAPGWTIRSGFAKERPRHRQALDRFGPGLVQI